MTSHTSRSLSIEEICAKVRCLGFGANQRVRLYGEEFEVISDPFPDTNGIAIRVRAGKGTETRIILLPATVLQGLKGRLPNAA